MHSIFFPPPHHLVPQEGVEVEFKTEAVALAEKRSVERCRGFDQAISLMASATQHPVCPPFGFETKELRYISRFAIYSRAPQSFLQEFGVPTRHREKLKSDAPERRKISSAGHGFWHKKRSRIEERKTFLVRGTCRENP